MTRYTIQIVSDTVCPWCYIGKKKLDAAISTFRSMHPEDNDTFEISWMPFYLNPLAPKTGINKRKYYESKFGPQRTEQIIDRITQTGHQNGISFSFDGLIGSTRDSHRLIQLGKTQSPQMQTRIVEEIFSLYFEHEGDITSVEALVAAAVRAGVEREEAVRWLGSGGGAKEVDREVEWARRRGVSGVPCFMVMGRYEVGGAQEEAVFVRLFERIKAEAEEGEGRRRI